MKDLEKYKEKFLDNLEYNCTLYKLIGNGTTESPMWFQLRANPNELDRETLFFANSQKSSISFYMPIEEDDQWILYEAFNDAYNYFRDLKYEYIKENHPTIYKQIR
jgi:hypothetical protein